LGVRSPVSATRCAKALARREAECPWDEVRNIYFKNMSFAISGASEEEFRDLSSGDHWWKIIIQWAERSKSKN